jgi:guanine deaminase
VRDLFPDARSYLDVYARAGLLHRRSVLAHGIWLDDDDRSVLREAGAQIAHSPQSNLFLGSGLFGWRAAEAAGVAVSLATDVGGGTDLSMLATLRDAYKVQAMAGQRLTAWSALHAATRGAAQALDLDDEIGSFEPGRLADLCVWEWANEAVATRRLELARSLHERLFAWLTLADRSHLLSTRIAGIERYRALR